MADSTSGQHHWNGVLNNALEGVGNTPLIRLDKIAQAEGLKCNLLGKCEFMSAGGSVKDRIAKRMIEHAEKEGILIPGQSVVIEPTTSAHGAGALRDEPLKRKTSDGSGIGLAMACAIKGYKCIITLPEKMSLEKEVMLRALGAEIVRTPTEAAWDSPESNIGLAAQLKEKIPGAVILDQYNNPNNPLAHELGTYPEIRYALKSSNLKRKDIAALVAGAGTGGTVTGLARGQRHAEKEDGVKKAVIVAVDPVGSILGGGDPGNYIVEGIGYDFYPGVLDRDESLIDKWVKVDDSEALPTAKRIVREEGLFIGGSSGSALAGALKFLKSEDGKAIGQDESANVVVIFPDSTRNYMSKPWFIKEEQETNPLREQLRSILGRDLDDPLRKRQANGSK
ncbi:cystathionine beta-synthase [Trichosporon asahii var. asahii CBS 2479]|uniref:cystathionine beta-synthase n=1 Tax=Trichosporon asahii var. asahii (strain ATCC 90039 / CBS 2479 / JCM 2466 / KCTC 7840 / NBRC 103889/ NCYC 2677 / UAMH 7654) TaxID=1186058 RepID=J6F2P3_TRIAS|nr:cystathionine beta-synthase [Trichosporon asahii var. asahii CBS 2479]EJT51249.1 cystathionine beta-synthase [Trichosporon asahii var. asahii CBS 2479]